MSTPPINNPARRAVITGAGVVSALGIGRDAFWAGLQRLRSPVRRLTLFDSKATKAKHAAWIDDWNAENWISPHRARRMDRCTQFGVVAARLAMEDAGIELTSTTPNIRAGTSIGTALGGFPLGEQWHGDWLAGKTLPPSLGLQIFPGSAQGNIAIEFGLQGPCTTNTSTCAAGNVALGDALRMIQHGNADVVIAGACEAPLSPMIFAAFDRMNAMSQWDAEPPHEAYRPFHMQRDGFVMGEGAAMFVVESLAHAQQRGARILGEIMGYAATNEAHHMSTPEPSGECLQRAMRLALADADVRTDEIDYLNAHASGTPANDANELAQIRAVFGEHATKMAISGTKPFTGHTLGAAGALEVLCCLLAMEHGWIPPTLNLNEPDAACDGLGIVAQAPIERTVRRVLTNSLGFGGIDTSVVLGRL